MAVDAPSEQSVEDAIKAAEAEAAKEADSAHASEIEDLLNDAESAFKDIAELHKKLQAIVVRDQAA